MRKLKVWGWAGFPDGAEGKQKRCIVAAASQKEAARLAEVSLHFFSSYAAETGNAKEVEVALANPRKVFFWDEDFRGKLIEDKRP